MGTKKAPILLRLYCSGDHEKLSRYSCSYDFILAKQAYRDQAKLALAKSQLAREARKVSTNLGRALR